MFERLEGKTTVITGASAGFGHSTALLFAKYGSHLVLLARRRERLDELKSQINSKYPNVKVGVYTLDVTDHEAVISVFQQVLKDFPVIDILVNNAGLALGLDAVKDVPESTVDTMLNTNVKGLLWVTQQILPSMISRNSGHIINVGSIAGITAYANGSIYCASKFAVHAISDSLRIETNATKIRVSEICPGMAETEFSIVRFGGDKEKADNFYKGIDPMTGDDIAEVIAFTASTRTRCVISNVVAMANGQCNPFVLHKET
ncbi:hypothetical protein BB560_000966 [Smittium megazygosporum]|uniref:Uncharacterized protein n=1 Tax=Smittium megazygosporum TaxID=133381 RepID=A0A2T9ZIU5_9FUNG|nr:hypothetical protein BB560_000966 [Smittium megazygosporum]